MIPWTLDQATPRETQLIFILLVKYFSINHVIALKGLSFPEGDGKLPPSSKLYTKHNSGGTQW